MVKMAEANPDIEVLVRRLRRGKAAVIRGHYGMFPLYRNLSSASARVILLDGPGLPIVNGRDKVICVNGLETNEITNKVSFTVLNVFSLI